MSELRVKLWGAARRFMRVDHSSPYVFDALLGGYGSGKSFAGDARSIMLGMLYPRSRILITAKTNRLLERTTMRKFREIIPWEWIAPESRARKWWTCPNNFDLVSGTNVTTLHADDVENLRGDDFNIIHVDEASTLSRGMETFLALLGRLRWKDFAAPHSRHPKRWLFYLTSNPEEIPGWISDLWIHPTDDALRLRREICDKMKLPYEPRAWRHFTMDTRENPYNPPFYAATLLSTMSPDLAEIFVEGHTGKGGKGVYHAFSRERNSHAAAPERCEYNPHAPLWISWDFNVDPMSFVLGHDYADGQRGQWCEAIAAVKIRHSNTPEAADYAARMVLARQDPQAPRRQTVEVWGDSTARRRDTRANADDKNRSDFTIIKQVFAQHGLNAIMRVGQNPSEVDRVKAVNAAFQNALGQVRFYVHLERCSELVRDFERVRWKDGALMIDKDADPLLTHVSDAVGYRIAARFPVRGSMYS